METPSILIVEDEEYLGRLYCEILGDYEVEIVKDGFKALAKEKKYELYIVDIGLPGMDGLETIERLKLAKGKIKTIVITGYDIEKHAKDFERILVNGALQKPFKVLELLNKVEEVLNDN
ncbi:MAG: response regulator [Thermodesulfobacteriota bacterium]|nr:response regulator [Thermodesulfobacteriota bacterium]